MKIVELEKSSVRELNSALHEQTKECTEREWEVVGAKGDHNLVVGLDQQLSVHIKGHAGYFCAGMNKKANVVVHGNVGPGVAENMMSGSVRVTGDASQSAGATAHGGLLLIECWRRSWRFPLRNGYLR